MYVLAEAPVGWFVPELSGVTGVHDVLADGVELSTLSASAYGAGANITTKPAANPHMTRFVACIVVCLSVIMAACLSCLVNSVGLISSYRDPGGAQ